MARVESEQSLRVGPLGFEAPDPVSDRSGQRQHSQQFKSGFVLVGLAEEAQLGEHDLTFNCIAAHERGARQWFARRRTLLSLAIASRSACAWSLRLEGVEVDCLEGLSERAFGERPGLRETKRGGNDGTQVSPRVHDALQPAHPGDHHKIHP